MFDLNDNSQDKVERSVYITNLSFKINNDDLERIFSQVGKVEASHAFYDKELLRPAGRGIVLFSKKEEAQRAIKELDNISIKGRKIKVQLNTKCIKLLDFKRGSVEEENPELIQHSSFSGIHTHENAHLSRASSSRRSLSGRHHGSHREHHSTLAGDYDYDDYDFHRRDRDKIRDRDKSRHGMLKYGYDPPFDHDYEYERSKSRANIKNIDRKIERRQISSHLGEMHDGKNVSPIREKNPIRIHDRELASDINKDSEHIYLNAPPVLGQSLLPPPPPILQMKIPLSSTIMPDPSINLQSHDYDQSIHAINATEELFSDIGTDIPHNIWIKVVKKRAQDVYNDLFSVTKDHQIIKDKVLLRFQPNEALTVSNFIDALSPSSK